MKKRRYKVICDWFRRKDYEFGGFTVDGVPCACGCDGLLLTLTRAKRVKRLLETFKCASNIRIVSVKCTDEEMLEINTKRIKGVGYESAFSGISKYTG